MKKNIIKDVRAYLIDGPETGGDYHDKKSGHWIVDNLIANPMSFYEEYKKSRTSFGINVMKSIVVEIENSNGEIGISAGQGGSPACYIIEKHFKRFLIGQSPFQLNKFWDQMFKSSRYYGGKGLTLWAISSVDLALWDLIHFLRKITHSIGFFPTALSAAKTNPDAPCFNVE